MAEEQKKKRPNSKAAPKTRSAPPRRRRRRRGSACARWLVDTVDKIQASQAEFQPDKQRSPFVRSLHFTRQQRMNLLRWVLLILGCILCLVIQDCVMSRIKLFGATTDLGVAAILLVGLLEGTETGSIFALLASTVYYFSGSAPGAYCVALITVPTMLCGLFRQKYWRRSTGSMLLCSSIAMLVYELGLFGMAVFTGVTHWGRLPYFAKTAVYTIVLMIPLYHLFYRIGTIGGHVWNE